MTVGKIERVPQNRFIQLLQAKLEYRYLGNWHDREDSGNIKEDILRLLLIHRNQSRCGNVCFI